VLPDVRDLGSDGEDGEEHAPDQDDDPFGLGHNPLANAATLALVEAQAFHQRKGDPPRWIPFFLTAAARGSHELAGFNDRAVDQTLAGTPS
jgi:hypothetical protein